MSYKTASFIKNLLSTFSSKNLDIYKPDSRERNNEYMKQLHLYADEVYVHALDLTFTENQPT